MKYCLPSLRAKSYVLHNITMIVAKEIKQRYDYSVPHILKLGEKVNQTLMKFCEDNNFAYTYRYKTLESLIEKIESGRYETWDDIDDLFASTIIIPSLGKEADVIEFIKEIFELISIIPKGATLQSPDIFRFDSTRIVCKIPPSPLSETTIFDNLRFEVQIRSAFEHAWTVTTHPLAYKTDTLTWNILRLVSQLKASVEQLDMLVIGASNISRHIKKHPWPELEAKIMLIEFVKEKIEQHAIPKESEPKDLSRFCDNIISLTKYFIKDKPPKIKSKVKEICKIIEEEIEKFGEGSFPKSLSLYQLFFSIIAKHGFLDNNTLKLNVLITPDMEMFYPEVKEFKRRFLY